MPYNVGCIELVGILNGWKKSARRPNATAPTTNIRSRNAKIFPLFTGNGSSENFFRAAETASAALPEVSSSSIIESKSRRNSGVRMSSSEWRRTLSSERSFRRSRSAKNFLIPPVFVPGVFEESAFFNGVHVLCDYGSGAAAGVRDGDVSAAGARRLPDCIKCVNKGASLKNIKEGREQ